MPSNLVKFALVALAAVFLAGGIVALKLSSGPRNLTIWYSSDDPIEQGWATSMVALFNKSQTQVRATIHPYGFEDFNTKMLLALGSGTPPDLAYATPRTCGIPVYVQNKELVNLTSYSRKYDWSRLLRPGLLQDYNSPFTTFAARSYGIQPRNVRVYAVPDAMAAVGMMYNVSLLHKLHLTVPRSLAQFAADVSIAKHAGYTPMALGNADGWLGDDWYQTLAGTRFSYSDLERELRVDASFTFLRPAFKKSAAILQGWTNDFTPNFAGGDAQDGVVSFFRGRSLFELVSSSEDAQIQSLQRQTHMPIGMFAFPGKSPATPGVMPQSGYEGWVVPKDGHNIAGAVTFINWMLKPSTTRFLLQQGVLPSEPVSPGSAVSSWQGSYLRALDTARPGVFLDAAPMPNINSTMEGNVEFLLGGHEDPSILPRALQLVYSSHGTKTGGKPITIDCEF